MQLRQMLSKQNRDLRDCLASSRDRVRRLEATM
jgi:hypothetical protein